MRKKAHFEHPNALVETNAIGAGTRVWAFAHILPGARIGTGCNLCDHTFIENDVVLGDRVTVKCGVQIWDGCRIDDEVFIGPNVTFTNDPEPRSGQHLDRYPETRVRKGASIGANATVLPGITIGQHSVVGAGAVVTKSVPPHAVVVGNPARIVRYVGDSDSQPSRRSTEGVTSDGTRTVSVEDVTLHHVPLIKDLRGDLSAREVDAGLPFVPRRYFVVFGVQSQQVRGEHAHRECEQLLSCLSGRMACVVDDGSQRQEILLDSPEWALYVPPLVWSVQYKYSIDAVLLVLASHPYDAEDYIRDYDQFLVARGDSRARGPASA